MRWGQRRLLWSVLAGITVLFALGPATHFRGLDWHLPYEVLWGVVPMLSRLNHPVRWLGLAGLFVVVLAADGLARRRSVLYGCCQWGSRPTSGGLVVHPWITMLNKSPSTGRGSTTSRPKGA